MPPRKDTDPSSAPGFLTVCCALQYLPGMDRKEALDRIANRGDSFTINLSGAILTGANLTGADLTHANLTGVIGFGGSPPA